MDFTNEITNRIKQLDLYLIPQFTWLVLLYFLMLNTCFKYFLKIKNAIETSDNNLNFKIPKEIISFNTTITHEISIWTPFLWFISISLIISGFFIAFLKFVPGVSSNVMFYHIEFGIYFGLWILLIVVTLLIYNLFGLYFPLAFPILYFITDQWDKVRTKYL